MTWRRYLLIPQVVWHALRAPRDQVVAWDRFWSGVGRTGPDGDVFWDAGRPAELEAVLGRLRAHADLGLPLVDLGCGNGRQARALAGVAPRVIGIDRSAAAIGRARRESAQAVPDGGTGTGEVEFRVVDAAEPGAGERLHAEFGDVNVHVRGVLHIVTTQQRRDLVANLAALLGRRGTGYLCETDIPGDGLDNLLRSGATPTSMPDPLRRLIAAGVRPPSHFGQEQVAEYFPDGSWQVLQQGAATLFGVPLRRGEEVSEIPGYFAVVRPRQ